MDNKTTREELLAQLQALLESEQEDIREKVESYKTQFYRLYHQEKQAAQEKLAEVKADIAEEIQEAKEDVAEVIADVKENVAEAIEEAKEEVEEIQENIAEVKDELESKFRALLTVYKERRAQEAARREQEMQDNLARKEAILEQIQKFAQSETADVSEHLAQVKELQAEWKTIGKVPPTRETAINQLYSQYLDVFYDLVQINHDLREYDFKKNLEAKTALCEQAEALQEKENIVEAFQALQTLHDEWKNIGPVAREVREEIWERFKAASTVINKRHQDHFTALHEQEEENQAKKQALIEKLKAIDFTTLTNNKVWDEATELVQNIQTEWRTIGYATKKFNTTLYNEYRALCDAFFAAKTTFYQTLRADLDTNLAKKRALVEQAQALKDSTDWKATTDKLVKLQAEWKKIGAVPRKHSDEVWKQFCDACDHFFEQKKAATQDQRSAEKENLDKKRAIIAQIEALEVTAKDETLKALQALMKEFAAVGFVPFRDKDKVHTQYKKACDRIFDALNVEAHNRRMSDFSKSVEGKDENALLNDRRRLLRQVDTLQSEIKTAENNILFFSTGNSKKGNKLVEDMERKIQQQKKQLAELIDRIELIDSKL